MNYELFPNHLLGLKIYFIFFGGGETKYNADMR